MSEWREVTLGDVVELKRGYDLPGSHRRAGDVPVISSAGRTGFHDTAKVRGPGVVTGRYGTLGEVFYIEEDFWPLNTSLYVRDFKGNYPRFVAALLSSLNLRGSEGAAAVPGLNRNHLHVIPVRVPDRETQVRIATLLFALDELDGYNSKRIELLGRMARAVYREWFVHFRYPGHEKTKFVDSTLGRIPAGWQVEPLANVCKRVTDGAHKSPPSTLSGFPMASVKDMRDWGINLETCRLISRKHFDDLVRQDCRPRVDDVLVAKDGSYLKHVTVVTDDLELVILSSIALLRPNGRLDPELLAACLREPETRARLEGLVSGAAIPRIILKDFQRFEIVVPPTHLQLAWRACVLPIINTCRSLVASIGALDSVRDLLLPKLVTGVIDVSRVDLNGLLELSTT